MEAPTAEPPTFAPDKIRGIEYEPNTAYLVLEEALGIKFKSPPKKARITDPKRINQLLRPDGEFAGGIYYTSSNTYFYWSRGLSDQLSIENHYLELHENAHAYIHQESPDIDPDNLDEVIMNLILQEGVADWMATETIGLLQDPNRQEDLALHYHIGSINTDVPGVRGQKIKEIRLDDRKNDLYEALSEIKSKALPSILASQNEIKRKLGRSINILGHYYALHHMHRLTTNGLSVSDALQVMIKNPPTSIKSAFDDL